MSLYYPEPDGTTFVDLFSYANTVTNDLWGAVSLLTFYFIIFASLRFYGTDKALVTASFLTFLISVLFYLMSWVADWVVLVLIVITITSLFFSDRRSGI